MRLFVALEVPDGPRREVERRLRALRSELPPARWVDLANVHLTLAFLGAVDAAATGRLAAALEGACAPHRPFTLRLAGGGTFPPGRPARVAWIGVDAHPSGGDLAGLQASVAAAAASALAGTAHEPESRPYHPHVTLARCSEPWPRSAAETFAAAFAGPLGEAFTAERAVLFESRQGRGGVRYLESGSFPLRAAGGGQAA
ncbi:MAG TPA: RNA 2',3'-cyclic phosphodiesterase [Thermoanaerobaculia bacterium]